MLSLLEISSSNIVFRVTQQQQSPEHSRLAKVFWYFSSDNNLQQTPSVYQKKVMNRRVAKIPTIFFSFFCCQKNSIKQVKYLILNMLMCNMFCILFVNSPSSYWPCSIWWRYKAVEDGSQTSPRKCKGSNHARWCHTLFPEEGAGRSHTWRCSDLDLGFYLALDTLHHHTHVT